MGNALDCGNQADSVAAKARELEEANQRVEEYKLQAEQYKRQLDEVLAKSGNGILKKSESFRSQGSYGFSGRVSFGIGKKEGGEQSPARRATFAPDVELKDEVRDSARTTNYPKEGKKSQPGRVSPLLFPSPFAGSSGKDIGGNGGAAVGNGGGSAKSRFSSFFSSKS